LKSIQYRLTADDHTTVISRYRRASRSNPVNP
jgi:hypothetical protein